MPYSRTIIIFLVGVVTLAIASPSADAVQTLPGYGKPPSPHFSGYLNADAATKGTRLHYWWASADVADPSTAPVVLWLNGGPGSSSVLGMLEEEGPLIINNEGNLMRNPWGWTRLAHLIVLESPAGVGYSYCANMTTGGACYNTDDTTSMDAYAALQDLFTTKFPEMRSNPFFITGESYAGVYCPTLAARIVDGNTAGSPKINLVGMAVGDPCTDNDSQEQSMDMLWYAHKYGLIMDDDYKFLVDECGYRSPTPHIAVGAWVAKENGNVVPDIEEKQGGKFVAGAPPNCTLVHRKYLLSSSRGISQSWDKAFINELSYYSPAGPYRFDIPGTWNYRAAQWMNSKDVRAALHVDNAPSGIQWPGPSRGWSYKSLYAACNGRAPKGTKSMIDFYRTLAPALTGKIVVYNGDTDPCVTYEGTRVAIEKVGFRVVGPNRPWFFNAINASLSFLEEKDVLFGGSLTAVAAGAQYGGGIIEYEHGLAFATVHGSGHMVPTFRPRAALQMIAHIVRNTAFSPTVPDDATLTKMSDQDFSKYLDDFVDDAKSNKYVTINN